MSAPGGVAIVMPAPRYGAACLCVALLAAACSQAPIRPATTHLAAAPARSIEAPPEPPSPVTPPRSAPEVPAETFTVVVHNVAVHELLFTLARNAKLNADIHSDVGGTVTLNAIEQTLPQLLERIARQVDLRYEIVGGNLFVMRDTPHLRAYRVDYVSAERRVEMRSDLSTQFGAASATGAPGASPASSTTGSSARVEIRSSNRLWDTLVENVKEILQEPGRVPPPAAAPQPVAAGAPPAPQAAAAPREAAQVIANRESGMLYVRASSRQHEKLEEFLNQVMARVKQQVLIEVTVAEVALNDEYQRGIDWQRLRGGATGVGIGAFGSGATGFEFAQSSAGTPAGINSNAFVAGYANVRGNFAAALKLLESFGTVRVLSSPKLSVLNNQTALLRVTRDLVYFTMAPQPVNLGGAGGGGTINVQAAFTTTPNVAAEGFMMGVLPQVGEGDAVVLNVRPTIRRKIRDVPDPNPALTLGASTIPEFETREFESVLRVQSGQTAVLGGLMQDEVHNVEDGIPGLSAIPLLGELFKQRKDVTRKIELVIFLRPTVLKEASLAGDFAPFRGLLPGADFFLKPDSRREDLRAAPRAPQAPDPAQGAAP